MPPPGYRNPKERIAARHTVRILNAAIFLIATALFYVASRRVLILHRRFLQGGDSTGIQTPSLWQKLTSKALLSLPHGPSHHSSRAASASSPASPQSLAAQQTAGVLRSTTASLQQGVASRGPPDMVQRGTHRGPRQQCEYSEDALRRIVALPHTCGFKNDRYFFRGRWLRWRALHSALNPGDREAEEGAPIVGAEAAGEALPEGEEERRRRGSGRSDVVECVLACKYHPDLRCSATRPCLHAFYLRHNSTDTRVLRQLYEWGEHQFLKPNFPFASILDAGANIGIASVLFANMYPDALIIAVEASPRNFRMLQRNTRPYPNILPVSVALWPRVAPLALVLGPRNPDLPPEWGYMVKETSQLRPGQAVEAHLTGVSIAFLLHSAGLQAFDFLKIDVEGSEGELFRAGSTQSLEWVDAAKLVALELHGDMVPGSNETVLSYFRQKGNFVHRVDWSGEYEVFMRKDVELQDKAQ